MTDTVISLGDMLEALRSSVTFMPRIDLNNAIQILIIAFLVYEILIWFRNTKAWTLFQGILVIFGFTLVCALFHLDTILWILEKIATIAVTALIIIFQPELRRVLEQLGNRNFLTEILSFDDAREKGGYTERTTNEIVKAVFEMAKVKTGALIVIERLNSLKEIERTGIDIDGLVTSQLLINIFEHNTPLHDGAVVIRGNRVTAATCYLPLSESMDISKELGTRHRAAVGVSENYDCLTVVVSEETGRVSLVEHGMLRRISDAAALKKELSRLENQQEESANVFMIWKGRKKNEGKADE